jgi:pimeloyl-ACP methyl ester carboxylesterase
VLVDVAHRFDHNGAQPIVDFMQANPEGFETPHDAELAVAAYLPHRSRPDDPNGILKNLRRRDGRWYWHWDPSLLRSQRPLVDPPAARERALRLADGIRTLSVPVLLIRGTISGVVTPEIAAEFSALNERADVVEVTGAGHMVAGDRNDAFAGAVVSFLEEQVPAA